MQKLGKNHGGYHGDQINIRAVLAEVGNVAREQGWRSETFLETGGGGLVALHRAAAGVAPGPGRRIYISAGIHGDEPGGPLAALRLVRENRWPADAEIFLLPCLNPLGFTLNTRENSTQTDLNRDYRAVRAQETRAHIAWLQRQPAFDLYLCLHEDWEAQGFYLYEQNPDHRASLAGKIIAAVKQVCPIDASEIIEGRAAQDGIVRPNVAPAERPDWPEALYLISHQSRQGYTLEAPSDFPLQTRVDALVTAVRAAMFVDPEP